MLKKKTGITKKCSPHILRHTFCTNLLHHGADITHIKDLAGHQDIQTTARYYLGKDKAVLRQIIDRCLDYRTATAGQPVHSLEPMLGPQANIYREAVEGNPTPQGFLLSQPSLTLRYEGNSMRQIKESSTPS